MMRALLIVVIIFAVLLLLSLIRLGGRAHYSADGMRINLLVGPLQFRLYPRKKKKKKERGMQHPEKDKKPNTGGSIELFRAFLPLLLKAAGYVKQKIRIDRIALYLTIAGDDPAATALAFGRANVLLGMIWPPIENNFNVKKRDIRTQVDFEHGKSAILIDAAFTMTVGQLTILAIRYGFQALKRYQAYKKAHNVEGKADSYGKEPSHQ